ncbi:hypothetical protein B1F69_20620, partial [Pseudomonas syringae]
LMAFDFPLFIHGRLPSGTGAATTQHCVFVADVEYAARQRLSRKQSRPGALQLVRLMTSD